METHLNFLREAYKFAVENSTDPSTQNGAVIVVDGKIVARGANHFPLGVQENDLRWQRPAKYQYVEHAERNAIYDAASRGVSTQGSIMYCPWFACADCGRAIIQSKITEVIGHNTPLHETSPNWKDSIAVAIQMFKEAGVKFSYVSGEIGETIRFNGVLSKV
jgi:dCMP deaminase